MISKIGGIKAIVLIVIGSILASCNKDSEEVSLGGNLISLNEGVKIEGVLVEIYTRKIESGIYSANYELHGTTNTDANGDFHFDLPNKSWASIKLLFSKEGYFNWDYELEGDLIDDTEGYYESFSLEPKAWVKFALKNNQPVDENDHFDYRIVNTTRNCDACCTSAKRLFQGDLVNEEFICLVVGHQELLIQWNLLKGGVQTGGTDNYFITAFDTTLIELFY